MRPQKNRTRKQELIKEEKTLIAEMFHIIACFQEEI